jgi:transcriptional regulator with GAF, ATPase, and Fis domain
MAPDLSTERPFGRPRTATATEGHGMDGSTPRAPEGLVEAFDEIAGRLQVLPDLDQTLHGVTLTATETVPGCDAASVSLVQKRGDPLTMGATGELALNGDRIQYDEGEGPCLDAAMTQRWVYTPDVGADGRWPRSSARMAQELGVGSLLSCRLSMDASPGRTLGGLNLYSTAPDAFDEQSRTLGLLLSTLAAVVVDASRREAQLHLALQSRTVIGEAVGLLRSQSDISSEDAFAMLVSASQRMNVKLREVAREITERPAGRRADEAGTRGMASTGGSPATARREEAGSP